MSWDLTAQSGRQCLVNGGWTRYDSIVMRY